MEDLLDRFYKALKFYLKRKFDRYIVKVSKVKGSFYVLVRKLRGKILNDELPFMINNAKFISEGIYKNNDNLRFMINNVKFISEDIYKNFAEKTSRFRYRFFPYYKLGKQYDSYQYHFLVVRKTINFKK